MRVIGYLDANSGSLLAGAIAAGAASIAVVFKTGIHRLTRGFKRKGKDQAAAPQESVSDPQL